MQAMVTREGPGFRGGGPTGYPANLFELPIFTQGGPSFADRGPRRNAAWMIFDVNVKYVGEVILPELLQRHLGTAGALEYYFELAPPGDPSLSLYNSYP